MNTLILQGPHLKSLFLEGFKQEIEKFSKSERVWCNFSRFYIK